MTGSRDDHQLIAACREGQTEAFGELVRRYQDRLYPTLLRLTGRAEDAQDLLQDAFLRAFEKLARFHGDSSFYTWIYRIAVNLALSNRRRRRPVLPLSSGRSGDPIDPPDDPGRTNPAAPLEQTERTARVQEALNALAPDHRTVIVLKDLEGLRYEEIASILEVPVGTVRSRLHRARGELRLRLQDEVEERSVTEPTSTPGLSPP